MPICYWGSIVSHWKYVCFLLGMKIICSFHGFPSDLVLGSVVPKFNSITKGTKWTMKPFLIRVEVKSTSHVAQKNERNSKTVSFKGVAFKCRCVDKSPRNNPYHTYNESQNSEHTHKTLHNIHTPVHVIFLNKRDFTI
jgi:hypothetical protein